MGTFGKLSKAELIDLVTNICDPALNDKMLIEYIDLLEKNVPHPAPSDLIFWNEKNFTPEEIVEIVLSYKEK